MNTHNLPPVILRLTSTPLLRWFGEDESNSNRTVRTIRVRELTPGRSAQGRRKRSGHFELRDEQDVRDWLRLHHLTLYVPSADAAVQSLRETGLLDDPPLGKRYSVYAMLPGDQIVALVNHGTELGGLIVRGEVELPYDAEAQAVAAEMKDPHCPSRAAAILDAHAAVENTIETIESLRSEP